MNAQAKRFFEEHVLDIADSQRGDWEYSNGDDMTHDAREFAAWVREALALRFVRIGTARVNLAHISAVQRVGHYGAIVHLQNGAQIPVAGQDELDAVLTAVAQAGGMVRAPAGDPTGAGEVTTVPYDPEDAYPDEEGMARLQAGAVGGVHVQVGDQATRQALGVDGDNNHIV